MSYYQDHEKYRWGYSENMKPIRLSFKNYYNQYVYNQDFANYDEITFNDISNPTKMIDNTRKFYPEAIIVEFKINGVLVENKGKDWTTLRLIFQNYKEQWYLSGIVNLKGVVSVDDKF